ncbi:putative cysteine-rich receptor-like protein kinase 33 [Bidens hawaiensis]|uniref:putative cysteine-rich receptor-like protein kinase 33 n=1 Tax=Bidens hawaiensis TaxID=980011 RepID=UPI0040498A3D
MPYEFDYDTMCVATNNFSDANIVPQSTFASIFEDVLLLLVRLQHENLLKFLGYYIKEATPFFVFELAENGSLDRLIYDPNGNVLGWNERYKIILGVARALLYLHYKNAPIRIVHGVVRPENILLDVNLEPKLSDFGFARCLIDEIECVDTDVIHWTLEHTALEHKLLDRLSTKSDVFSFGMLILKIISGCRTYTYNGIPVAKENFLQYVSVIIDDHI